MHLSPRLSAVEALGAWALMMVMTLAAAPVLYALLGLPAMAIIQLVLIAGPAVALALARGGFTRISLHTIGLRRPPAISIVGAILVGATFWYLNNHTAGWFARTYLSGDRFSAELSDTLFGGPTPVWLVVVIVSVFPALCEEVLMRGTVTRGLVPRLGPAVAILVSAALFGIMHLNPPQMLTTFVFGLVLGYSAVVSDSAIPAIIMHFLNNALALIVALEVIPVLTEVSRESPALWAPIAGILSLSGCLLIRKGSVSRPRTTASNPW